MTRTRKLLASLFASALIFGGIAAPATAQQVGLVNVSIGNVTILRDVDVALAANVVANVCNVPITANVLSATIEQTGTFTCSQRGSGRPVAVTG